jgi:serine protease AprX
MKQGAGYGRDTVTAPAARWGERTVALLAFVLLTLGIGQGQVRSAREDGSVSWGQKLAPEVSSFLKRGQMSDQPVEVIVQFKRTPAASTVQRIAGLGAVRKQNFAMIPGGVFHVPASKLQALAADPEVAYISPNRPLAAASDYTEATVGADVVQSYGLDGTGVTIAVIDSGISDHPDLHDPMTGQSRVVYSQSFVPGTDTNDHYGHGTHVAGILAGNASQSGGLGASRAIYGVAPHVSLVNLKVLDSNGSGQDSYVIAAIQRAIALQNVYNIQVINLSLGRPVYESYQLDPLCQAVEAAWKAGIVVVVAAGNLGRDNDYGTHGYGLIAAPGNDPYVITVGAMNAMGTPTKNDDVITTYSSKGPSAVDHVIKPDLVAPGNRIASLLVPGSTLDQEFPTNEVLPVTYGGFLRGNRYYFTLSGTSMATPVVSGAAALLLEADSSATPDEIKARLMKSADKTFPNSTQLLVNNVLTTYQYDVFTVGSGYLNIPNALANHDAVQGTALSPIAVINASGTATLVADPSSVWSNSVIWGSSVIWGNCIVSGSSVIWGNSVVWGSSTMSGFSVVWGNSVVWGSSMGSNDALSIDDNGDAGGQ